MLVFSKNSLLNASSIHISKLKYLKAVVFLSGCDYLIDNNDRTCSISSYFNQYTCGENASTSPTKPLSITIEHCERLEVIMMEPLACIRGSNFKIESLNALQKLVIGKSSPVNSINNMSLCLSLCRELRLFNYNLPNLLSIEVGNWSLSRCTSLYLPCLSCELLRGVGALLHTVIQ